MKKNYIGKREITFLMALVILLTMLWIPDVRMKAEDTFSLSGMAHVQTKGDTDGVWDGNVLKLGTTGQGKRLEAITIDFKNNTQYEGSIQYRVHRQTYGWTSWVNAGEQAGTTGQGKRLEAIEIKLTGELAKHYSVKYRVHAQTYGWNQGWQYDGALAGTAGEAKRLECLEIQIVPREENVNLSYRVHRQTFGWEKKWLTNGQVSGTTGQSKRLEGITIALTGNKYSGSVHYRTHVQSYGWMNTVKDGTMSGTQGEAKRLEAIEIALSGNIAKHYDIYYRVHSQTYGWLGWAKNGEPSGTAGGGKRLEAIQIALVEKGGYMPPATYGGVTSDCTNAYINLSNTPTNNLVIDSGAQGDESQGNESQGNDESTTTEDTSNSNGNNGLFDEQEPDYAEGDHIHNWEQVSGQLKNGVACNGCYKDITDYEDYYDCCGGWHTHSWMLVPSHYKCTICDVKVHRHSWRWIKPKHYSSSEEVMTEGHYMCYGCFMRCWDGGEADPSVYPYSWDSAAFDASEYIMEVQYADEKDYTLTIESITIRGTIVCMVPGDTKKLSVIFTPEDTTDDRTIKWESNNPDVVSVDKDGNLTANSLGYAEIKAYSSNGKTDVSHVRVMETNILDVKSARIYVNGVDVTDKEFYVKTDENPTIEVRTVPENAIYTVKYTTTRLDDKKKYSVEVYPVEVGGVSQWAWVNSLAYTNSAAQMRVYNASTSTEITATVTDLEGNEYILKTRAIKQ